MRIIVFLTVIALAAPAAANGLGTSIRITTHSATDFTAEFRSRARLVDYWCAAGNHVTNRLRMSDRTRVFRMSPPPRQSGQGVRFTLDASRSAGDTGMSTFGGPQDGSFSAGSAYAQFCITIRPGR